MKPWCAQNLLHPVFMPESKQQYACQICGFIYDPKVGDPSKGVPSGTSFEELPETWACPICGKKKDYFDPYPTL